ncbi:hypothetical protein JL721_3015 [Aureococcus anophagefferens]|nr:hypothetical protein JL721_3015 [Aureococcus anophagefferens]
MAVLELISAHVRALREGDDASKMAAVRALLAFDDADLYDISLAIAKAGGIPPLVELLRDGSAEAKLLAVAALCNLAYGNAANKVLIAEAGAVPPLVELLRSGSAEAKDHAVCALSNLARDNDANTVLIAAAGAIPLLVLIAEAGAIPLLLALFRDGDAQIKEEVEIVLRNLADDNDANAVAIAAAVGFDAVVELARRGRVIVDGAEVVLHYYTHQGVPAQHKAALVVAALIDDCVPVDSVPRVIKDIIIITYL